MLNFIGIGSALNPKLGNNGAFVKSHDGKTMFMIDCGETTYARLMNNNILDGVESIHVLMTHFHPDHSGSLGSLIFEMFYRKQPFVSRVTVYTPDIAHLNALLTLMGLRPDHYTAKRLYPHTTDACIMDSLGVVVLSPIAVSHDTTLSSFAYLISMYDFPEMGTIYYSGDSTWIPDDIIHRLKIGVINTIYQDVSSLHYEGNVHMSLLSLDNLIEKELRKYIYCMHLDKGFNRSKVRRMGFNVVTCKYK